MSAPIDLRNPGRTIRAGVILMGGETEILDVAPIDLLNGASEQFLHMIPPEAKNDKIVATALNIDFYWVNETGEPAKMSSGIKIQPTNTFANCPQLDIVLMGAVDVRYNPNETEIAFVKKAYDECAAFLTICGGFRPLHMAGVLAGKSVAVPRPLISTLESADPRTEWLPKRWHRDGKIWSSGILLNGLEMMRAFGKEFFGGNDTLMDSVLEVGHWPERNVNYADTVNPY